ncbi:MAG TPA: hypothetical protein VNU68_35995 [Verrucomicrobiae bacterium]|nr:hypothetical protein [Verrucomicrobiae bacterium]
MARAAKHNAAAVHNRQAGAPGYIHSIEALPGRRIKTKNPPLGGDCEDSESDPKNDSLNAYHTLGVVLWHSHRAKSKIENRKSSQGLALRNGLVPG